MEKCKVLQLGKKILRYEWKQRLQLILHKMPLGWRASKAEHRSVVTIHCQRADVTYSLKWIRRNRTSNADEVVLQLYTTGFQQMHGFQTCTVQERHCQPEVTQSKAHDGGRRSTECNSSTDTAVATRLRTGLGTRTTRATPTAQHPGTLQGASRGENNRGPCLGSALSTAPAADRGTAERSGAERDPPG